MKIKYLLILLIIFICGACRDDIVMKNTPENVFLAFWHTLDENYVYFQEKGVDWDSIYNVYYPHAVAAHNDEELMSIFRKIVPLFNDRHLLVWGKLINSYPISTFIPSDTISYISYLDVLDYDFTRKFEDETRFEYFQNANKNYAFVVLSSFDDISDYYKTDLNNFTAYLSKLNFQKGLIIDISMNSGGSTRAINKVSSLFFDNERITYYRKYKNGKGHNDFTEMIPQYVQGVNTVSANIPVILLTSNSTYSAANFFAFIMNDLPNVTIIGGHTGGGGGGATNILLPNSWKLSYPADKAYSSQGVNMEFGLEPDIFVNTKHLIDETDPTIARAIEVLDSISGY